jgi:hypothetical protein
MKHPNQQHCGQIAQMKQLVNIRLFDAKSLPYFFYGTKTNY